MRIAVTYENGQIFQHFGRTAQFKVYDVQDGESPHPKWSAPTAAATAHWPAS